MTVPCERVLSDVCVQRTPVKVPIPSLYVVVSSAEIYDCVPLRWGKVVW